jgi:hypothetical protein
MDITSEIKCQSSSWMKSSVESAMEMWYEDLEIRWEIPAGVLWGIVDTDKYFEMASVAEHD